MNEVVPFKCEQPEEYDFHQYWNWIYEQVVPLLSRYVSDNKQNPINFIYMGNNQNNPSVLHQHLKRYFKMSDFDLTNTQNEIYDR